MFYLLNVWSPYGGVNVFPFDEEDAALRKFEDASCPFSCARRVELKTSRGDLVKSWVNAR